MSDVIDRAALETLSATLYWQDGTSRHMGLALAVAGAVRPVTPWTELNKDIREQWRRKARVLLLEKGGLKG